MSILICYDGSPSSKRALAKAAAVLDGEHAVILHVWSPPERYLADAFSTRDSSGPSYEELTELVRKRAQEIAEEGVKLADTLGLEAEATQAESDSSVWRTILDVAERQDVDLIVAGTHGETAVEPALLGSVSNALAHHSDRAVLIVPNGHPSA
jgi:nucleotide-binding universal stress UspA family protein